MHIDHIPTIIAAACVLHNVCEVNGEHFNDAWINNGTPEESNYDQPSTVIHRGGANQRPKEIREALIYHFSVLELYMHLVYVL